MFSGDEYRSRNAPGSPARRLRRRALHEPHKSGWPPCPCRNRNVARGYRFITDSRRNRSPIVGVRLHQSVVEQEQH
jgi:hypothetical protein